MSARTAALRFRIWQYAAPREWDVTCGEIAEALGKSPRSVGSILRHTGWHNRVRAGSKAVSHAHFGGISQANFAAHIAAQVVAGRISSEAAI